MTYIVLLWLWFRSYHRKTREHYLLMVGGMILILLPIGSDKGLEIANYGMWLALVTMIAILWETAPAVKQLTNAGANILLRFIRGWKTGIALLLLVSVIWYPLARIPLEAPRRKMRWQVNHPLLHGLFTSQTEAKHIGDVIAKLSKYVKPGDYLLAFNRGPLLCYLTDTHPYMYSPDPLLYTHGLNDVIAEAEADHPYKPVAVMGKREFPRNKNQAILRDHLIETGYTMVWHSEAFEIWLPPSSG